MNPESKPFGVKFAEFSQKLDIIQIGVGGVIFIFNPGVGFLIVGGSAVTYGMAEWYKRGKRNPQLKGA